MQFTQQDKDQYLDKLALLTQQGIWQTEMALMKTDEQLGSKRTLLAEIDLKIDRKEYPSARDGKNEKAAAEEVIAKLQREIKESEHLIQTGKEDLELIEKYRIS